jgi:hypothetical protein
MNTSISQNDSVNSELRYINKDHVIEGIRIAIAVSFEAKNLCPKRVVPLRYAWINGCLGIFEFRAIARNESFLNPTNPRPGKPNLEKVRKL